MTGPRQVGKTTVLRNCDPDRRYVSLDKLELRILAQENPQMDWEDFYSSYIQTYIERDIRELINVGEEIPFTKFITAVASRTGQLLNYSDIAKDIGKNVPTVQRWLSLLVASGLVYLLYPYAQSIGTTDGNRISVSIATRRNVNKEDV